jgi:hypothetical protein
MSTITKSASAVAAAAVSTLVMGLSDTGLRLHEISLSRAEAIIGRPLTPMSYAGVARRTTRRAVVGGAAVAGAAGAYYAAPVYGAPGCAQVVDAYGRIVYRCP